jgi:hypothetical protein
MQQQCRRDASHVGNTEEEEIRAESQYSILPKILLVQLKWQHSASGIKQQIPTLIAIKKEIVLSNKKRMLST